MVIISMVIISEFFISRLKHVLQNRGNSKVTNTFTGIFPSFHADFLNECNKISGNFNFIQLFTLYLKKAVVISCVRGGTAERRPPEIGKIVVEIWCYLAVVISLEKKQNSKKYY